MFRIGRKKINPLTGEGYRPGEYGEFLDVNSARITVVPDPAPDSPGSPYENAVTAAYRWAHGVCDRLFGREAWVERLSLPEAYTEEDYDAAEARAVVDFRVPYWDIRNAFCRDEAPADHKHYNVGPGGDEWPACAYGGMPLSFRSADLSKTLEYEPTHDWEIVNQWVRGMASREEDKLAAPDAALLVITNPGGDEHLPNSRASLLLRPNPVTLGGVYVATSTADALRTARYIEMAGSHRSGALWSGWVVQVDRAVYDSNRQLPPDAGIRGLTIVYLRHVSIERPTRGWVYSSANHRTATVIPAALGIPLVPLTEAHRGSRFAVGAFAVDSSYHHRGLAPLQLAWFTGQHQPSRLTYGKFFPWGEASPTRRVPFSNGFRIIGDAGFTHDCGPVTPPCLCAVTSAHPSRGCSIVVPTREIEDENEDEDEDVERVRVELLRPVMRCSALLLQGLRHASGRVVSSGGTRLEAGRFLVLTQETYVRPGTGTDNQHPLGEIRFLWRCCSCGRFYHLNRDYCECGGSEENRAVRYGGTFGSGSEAYDAAPRYRKFLLLDPNRLPVPSGRRDIWPCQMPPAWTHEGDRFVETWMGAPTVKGGKSAAGTDTPAGALFEAYRILEGARRRGTFPSGAALQAARKRLWSHTPCINWEFEAARWARMSANSGEPASWPKSPEGDMRLLLGLAPGLRRDNIVSPPQKWGTWLARNNLLSLTDGEIEALATLMPVIVAHLQTDTLRELEATDPTGLIFEVNQDIALMFAPAEMAQHACRHGNNPGSCWSPATQGGCNSIRLGGITWTLANDGVIIRWWASLPEWHGPEPPTKWMIEAGRFISPNGRVIAVPLYKQNTGRYSTKLGERHPTHSVIVPTDEEKEMLRRGPDPEGKMVLYFFNCYGGPTSGLAGVVTQLYTSCKAIPYNATVHNEQTPDFWFNRNQGASVRTPTGLWLNNTQSRTNCLIAHKDAPDEVLQGVNIAFDTGYTSND